MDPKKKKFKIKHSNWKFSQIQNVLFCFRKKSSIFSTSNIISATVTVSKSHSYNFRKQCQHSLFQKIINHQKTYAHAHTLEFGSKKISGSKIWIRNFFRIHLWHWKMKNNLSSFINYLIKNLDKKSQQLIRLIVTLSHYLNSYKSNNIIFL